MSTNFYSYYNATLDARAKAQAAAEAKAKADAAAAAAAAAKAKQDAQNPGYNGESSPTSPIVTYVQATDAPHAYGVVSGASAAMTGATSLAAIVAASLFL